MSLDRSPYGYPRGVRLWKICVALSLAGTSAWAGSPRVSSAYPSVGQRGTEVEVAFFGSGLSDARTILFDAPGFDVTTVKAEAARYTAKIRIPSDALLGEHRLRVITNSGVSDLRAFFVSPYPILEESFPTDPSRAAAKAAEAKAAAAAAKAAAEAAAKANPAAPAPAVAAVPAAPVDGPQEIALNTTVYGHTQGEDLDQFVVQLEKGKRLSVDVVGMQLQTQNPYDPEVIVRKPDGSVFKSVAGTSFGRGNPVFSAIVPEDGKYTVTIHDSTRAGAGACHYFMHIGDFPRPLIAYPAGGPVSKQTQFTLLGDPLGPIQTTASPGIRDNSIGSVFPSTLTPSPLVVRVADMPNVLESKEQTASPADAKQVSTIPAAFNGIISKPKENDYFRFAAKKGQVYEVTAFARSLRSPLDSVIEILDAKGARLTLNDDAGKLDSYLRWTAPADGEFLLGVRDQMNRGGDLFVYRVEIKTPEPTVKAWLPEVILNSSQERRAVVVPRGNRYATMVRIKREDWAGAIDLEALNLPNDVTATVGYVDKTIDTAVIVFEAKPDAALDQKLFTISGKPVVLPAPAPVANGSVNTSPAAPAPAALPPPNPKVVIEHLINICENGNQPPYYTVSEHLLPIAVVNPLNAEIEVEQPKAPAIRGCQFGLKVKVKRSGEFKGPVNVALLYAPNGLGTSGTVKIPENSDEITVPVSVSPTAPLNKWPLCVIANADFGSGTTWFSSKVFEFEVVESPLAGSLVRTSLSQGAEGSMKLNLEQKTDFEGKVKIELLGLPNGVSAEPQEADSTTKQVTFALKAKPDAALGMQKQVTAQFTLQKNGVSISANCAAGGILRVDRGEVVAAAKPASPTVPTTPAAPAPPAPAAPAPAPVAAAKPATPAAGAPAAPAPAATAAPAPAPAAAAKPATPAAGVPAAPAPAAPAAPAPAPAAAVKPATPTAGAPAAPAPAAPAAPAPAPAAAAKPATPAAGASAAPAPATPTPAAPAVSAPVASVNPPAAPSAPAAPKTSEK